MPVQQAPREPFLQEANFWAQQLRGAWDCRYAQQPKITTPSVAYVGALRELNRLRYYHPRTPRAALKAVGFLTMAGLVLLREESTGGPFALCFKKFLRAKQELEGGIRLLL